MYVMFFNFIEKYWQNQFPTTILWSSLIILDHPCIFWNHLESWHIFGNFWILLGYIGDLLEIYHQGFISYHQLYSANMYNFDISISYKNSFFLFTNYKSDIFHFALFSRCVSPLCLPFLSPRCVSPVCLTVFGSKSSSQPFRLSAKKEQTDGNRWIQNETKWNRATFKIFEIEGVDSEHLEPLNSINLGVHKAS